MNFNKYKAMLIAVTIGFIWNDGVCLAGQPQPVSGSLGNGQSYSIPDGKILLLDCLSYSVSGIGGVQLGGGTIYIYNSNNTVSFQRPIKLQAGEKISYYPVSSAVSYWGTLIDVADLYVSIPNQFDSVRVTNNVLVASVGFKTKEPATVKIEKSSDLKTWMTDTNAVIPVKNNQTNLVFTVPVGDGASAFYRTKVTPR